MSTGTDRHKTPRVFKSGAQKRKLAKEQDRKTEQALAKTRSMSEFITVQPRLTQETPCQRMPENNQTVPADDDSVADDASKCDLIDSQTQVIVPKLNGTEEDVGLWPEHTSAEMVNYWAKKGCSDLQYCDDDLLKSRSVEQKIEGDSARRCQLSMFERKNHNGEIIKRTWLCFSPANGKLYCFVCKLVASTHLKFTHGGFCDWKHAGIRLKEHEQSSCHLNAVIAFVQCSKEIGRINIELTQQADQVIKYWRSVLKRVLSAIKFLSERGLAFRGENEILGSVHNGNYLGLLELVAEYDDFLKQHIQKHANSGTGHVNYLSSTICEEFIQLMGKQVFAEIIARIKKSRYYSISLDSTTDESRVDQLTLIFRYMEHATPVERFVEFMPNQGHKAQDMFNSLVRFLKTHEIDIKDCRGQSYDNASAMSGRYNGLQALVMSENCLAAWIPCVGHSLNLVGLAAAECCLAAVTFFDFLEQIYVFFTASTNRYQLLIASLKSANNKIYVPKRISTTRWSCRADAIKALVKGFPQIRDTLAEIADDPEQTSRSRCDANTLYERMCTLETGIYLSFWYELLDRVNSTSLVLQDPKLDMNSAVACMTSLKNFVEAKRECFNEFEQRGVKLSGTSTYIRARQRRPNVRLNPLDYGQASGVELTVSEKFRIENFLPIIDKFLSALQQRIAAYEQVNYRFGFFSRLHCLSHVEIQDAASQLANVYKDDLDQCFGNELIQFVEFSKLYRDEKSDDISNERYLYGLLLDKGVKDAFPNVEIALRMYLVLMVANCSGERSFSKLKYIKNRLRTTMTQDRLNNLTIMSIEHDILREMDFDQLIDSFAHRKSRKVPGL